VVEPNRLRTEVRPNTLGAGLTGASPNANVLTPGTDQAARAGAAFESLPRAPAAPAGTARMAAGPRRRTWRRGFLLSLLVAAAGAALFFSDDLSLVTFGIALVLGGLGFAIVSGLLDSAAREAADGASLRALAARTAFLPHSILAWLVGLGMIALGLLFFVTAIDTR
jgi:hypothetical protein